MTDMFLAYNSTNATEALESGPYMIRVPFYEASTTDKIICFTFPSKS